MFANAVKESFSARESARTVANKFESVVTFLKQQGLKLIQKGDWPKFTEEELEIYEREDLDRFFAACTDEERLWFDFFLMTVERGRLRSRRSAPSSDNTKSLHLCRQGGGP